MKTTLLAFVCLCFSTSFGQFVPIGYIPYVFSTARTIGGEIRQMDAVHKTKQQQQEADDKYFAAVFYADNLMGEKKYEDAINSYNEALKIKPQEQYPIDQIAKATTELTGLKDEQFGKDMNKGDSLYIEMRYAEAIDYYQKALTSRNDQLAIDQLGKAHQELYRSAKVQFSGLLISDLSNANTSKATSTDPFSDFISSGKYNSINQTITYSNNNTLDGIVVPAKTRLIVYSQEGFQGKILLDITGPAIVNNMTKQKDEASQLAHSKVFVPRALQEMYPQSVRSWSSSDMSAWVKGSMEIIAL